MPSGAAPSAGGAEANGVPVVVGTVAGIRDATVTVKNLGGRTVTVTVLATARVTTTGMNPLASGVTVAVYGTKSADGTVTATAVVARGTTGKQ
jgi:hypothetical protein